MWKSLSAVVIVLAGAALAALPVGSAEEGKSIEQMITQAKTPADHEAIATYYEKEAQDVRQKQAQHQKMSEAYAKIPPLSQKTSAVWHCDTIAKNYGETAKDYEDLAKLHREMAKATQ